MANTKTKEEQNFKAELFNAIVKDDPIRFRDLCSDHGYFTPEQGYRLDLFYVSLDHPGHLRSDWPVHGLALDVESWKVIRQLFLCDDERDDEKKLKILAYFLQQCDRHNFAKGKQIQNLGKELFADIQLTDRIALFKQRFDFRGFCYQFLHIASWLDVVDKFEDCVCNANLNVYTQGGNKRTPSHFAAMFGCTDSLRILQQHGADFSLLDIHQNTPLHLAALGDNKDACEVIINCYKLLKEEGDSIINSKNDENETALLIATVTNNTSMIKILVDHGAKLHVGSAEHVTPLHSIAERNSVEAMRHCLNHLEKQHRKNYEQIGLSFTDLLLTPSYITRSWWTILFSAVEFGGIDVTEVILNKLRDVKNEKEASHAATADDFVNARDVGGRTVLHLAIEKKHNRMVEFLLKNGAKTGVPDTEGNTPLHWAATYNNHAAVQFIAPCVKNKANIVEMRNVYGETALNLAAKRATPRLVDSLLDCNADLTAGDNEGNTPLHSATERKKYDIIEYFLDKRSELSSFELSTIKNKRGCTALLLAAMASDRRAVEAHVSRIWNIRLNDEKHFRSIIRDTVFRLVRQFVKTPASLNVLSSGLRAIVRTLAVAPDGVDKLTLLVDGNEFISRLSLHRPLLEHVFKDEDLFNKKRMLKLSDANACASLSKRFSISFSTEASLMDFICSVGAVDMLKEILDVPGLYKFEDENYVVYKVDYLYERCLPIIAYHNVLTDENRWKMLDIEPLASMTEPFWKLTECFVKCFIALHLIYMTIFTYYNIPTVESLMEQFNISPSPDILPGDSNNFTSNFSTSSPTRLVHDSCVGILWLLWPLLVFVFDLVFDAAAEDNMLSSASQHFRQTKNWCYRLHSLHRNSRAERMQSLHKDATRKSSKKTACFENQQHGDVKPNNAYKMWLTEISKYAYQIVSGGFIFLCLVITWYCANMTVGIFSDLNYQRYLQILAVTLIFGWMQTLKYFTFIRTSSEMFDRFSNIVRRDIFSMFIILFVFIVLGFGFALHVLHLTTLGDGGNIRTPVDSIYLAFFAMLGQGDLFSDTTDDAYRYHGGNVDLLRIVFCIFICFSTIVMLNILIAMMNSTYQDKVRNCYRKRTLLNLRCGMWLWSTSESCRCNLDWFVTPFNITEKTDWADDDSYRLLFDPDYYNVNGTYLWISKMKEERNVRDEMDSMKQLITQQVKQNKDLELKLDTFMAQRKRRQEKKMAKLQQKLHKENKIRNRSKQIDVITATDTVETVRPEQVAFFSQFEE